MAIINRYGLQGRDDFLGFSFNGRHSSEFNIIRVANSDYYDEILLAAPRDVTTQITGRDGVYFFNSTLDKKSFSINIAFDDLHEEQFADLTAWLAKNEEGELIFDERPYKTYFGKISSPPQMKYICFDDEWEEETGSATLDARLGVGVDDLTSVTKSGRTYKGTGTIQFTCSYPLAYAKGHTVGDYTYTENGVISVWPNVDDWQTASRIHTYNTVNDTLNGVALDSLIQQNYIFVYNAGDTATPFQFRLSIPSNYSGNQYVGILYRAAHQETPITYAQADAAIVLDINKLKPTSGVKYYILNTENNLILECSAFNANTKIEDIQYTGKVFNNAHVAGDFFKLAIGPGTIYSADLTSLTSSSSNHAIDYNYWYY